MIASCTPGISTSRLSYSDGILSATVEGRENPYTLIDGVLYGKQYLDGTITASAWVFPHESFDRTVEYQYNHAGLRVEKVFTDGDTVTTTKYTLNGANVVGMTVTNTVSDEIVSADTMHFFYDASNQLAMVNFNGVVYSYVKNLQGDIVGILDSDGILVVEYYYDAWGKPLLTRTLTTEYDELARLNPFRYRGYVYDEETELYYLRSRHYIPIWSRFVNADSLIYANSHLLAHNVYAYADNTPVVKRDDSGYDSYVGTVSEYATIICQADGPLPFGDIIVLALYTAALLVDAFTYLEYETLSESEAETKTEENKTYIYRRASGTPKSLTPRPVDTNGLSFSTIQPVTGKYVRTTMEKVNSTGVLWAVYDPLNPTHVLVNPINVFRMPEWIASREAADTNPHPYTVLLMALLE